MSPILNFHNIACVVTSAGTDHSSTETHLVEVREVPGTSDPEQKLSQTVLESILDSNLTSCTNLISLFLKPVSCWNLRLTMTLLGNGANEDVVIKVKPF